jgi:hypothetical protein
MDTGVYTTEALDVFLGIESFQLGYGRVIRCVVWIHGRCCGKEVGGW